MIPCQPGVMMHFFRKIMIFHRNLASETGFRRRNADAGVRTCAGLGFRVLKVPGSLRNLEIAVTRAAEFFRSREFSWIPYFLTLFPFRVVSGGLVRRPQPPTAAPSQFGISALLVLCLAFSVPCFLPPKRAALQWKLDLQLENNAPGSRNE